MSFYVHGNSVGGTNPALLEAMAACPRIMAIDTVFNHEVLGETGIYFDSDDITSCFAEFGLDPQESRRPTGEFQVKAVVEIAEDMSVESGVFNLNLLKKKMPAAERKMEEILLAKGRYAYKRGLYDEALGHVQTILKTKPDSLPALDLLGDIEERRGNLPAALSAYERALEEFLKQLPDIREPPRALENKINRLRARDAIELQKE